MFTGIIAAVGQLKSMQTVGGDIRLHIDSAGLDLNDVKLGDSIAVNGVCLTVVEKTSRSLQFDVSQETLQRSSLGQLKTGSEANLEKALAVGDRLGGHLVSGHVDGLGEVMGKTAAARSWQYKIKVPTALERYIAEKGSITIDGVSLTVNGVFEGGFDINIIPHTLEETIIKHYQIGTKVNLEVDLIARYLERLLPQSGSNISRDFLSQHGYIR